MAQCCCRDTESAKIACVLFVGPVTDRISDLRPFEALWSKGVQMGTADVEAMQKGLTARGAYQKANGLRLDCWPTSAVLPHARSPRRRSGAVSM
jgi:hypothetical protein